MLLNIIAAVIPIAVLQLVVLPLMAADMDPDAYGLALTLISMISFCPSTLGNVINNIRLLHNTGGKGSERQSDYSVIALAMAIVGALASCAFTIAYEGGVGLSTLLMLVIGFAVVVREYLIVAYRLNLNFKAILLNNICMAVGYFAGYGLFLLCGFWELVYLTGNVASLVYVFLTTTLWKEPFAVSPKLKELISEALLLLASGLLGRATTYADRMVLYPLMGGQFVAVYYVATLFGKMLSMVINPINSVVLSYVSRLSKKSDRMFWYSLAGGACGCVVVFVLTMLLARPVLGFLYPAYVDEAMGYVWIVTIASCFAVLTTILNPYILKFFSIKWQPALSGLFCLVYFLCCLGFLSLFGPMGFCAGVLLAEVVKLVLQIVIYVKARPEMSE
ncbi:MAG: hypothetical protein Q4E12_06625 [Coriobacteriia bacterium]|nr:hypothetical protein [Coriobacteriia bacterium]